MRMYWATLLIGLTGCPPTTTVPPLEDGACDVAEERLGEVVCVHRIDDTDAWDGVARTSPIVDRRASTKWLMPATPDAYLQELLFLNMNAYQLHWQFMAEAFPDAFPALTQRQYSRMVLDPVDREYFSGDMVEFIDGSSTVWGFTIWDDPADEDGILSQAQVGAIYAEIAQHVAMRPLVWVPNSNTQRQTAEGWTDSPFPIRTVGDDLRYEVYTQGTGIGRVQTFTSDELAQAQRDASFSYQDLLVLEQAPFDIERPIAGVVTGTRQGELSHLNLRAASRGTPNCYVADPLAAFESWDGQLVALTCGERGYTVRSADSAEAEAYWQSIRPEPVDVPTANNAFADPVPLLAIQTRTATDRRSAVATFGSKGANLGALYQRTPAEIQLEGFVLPFYWYIEFVDNTTWQVDLGDGAAEHSFAATLDAWHDDPRFLTDALYRKRQLDDLNDAMRDANVDPVVLELLTTAIRDTWGREDVMVRFRSSSNAEDALAFNGAGLYDSTSACLADSLDSDDDGPSLCDPDQDRERTLERALKKVWASTWNVEAWEERDWYGIEHTAVAMGVLVNTRSKDEQANIVAFTGNPTADDDRFVINAQFGEWDVVSAEPGVAPERILVTMTDDGTVETIERVSSSTMGPGLVLSNEQVTALATQLDGIRDRWPIDEPPPADRTVLLDTEWKVLEDGRLIVKQIRPFLR